MKPIAARLAVLAGLLAAALAFGDTPEEPEPVHWAYSSFFGTGWYHVDDNRTVYVFSLSPRKRFNRASWDEGKREIGFEFHYPVTLGLHKLDFDDLPGNLIPSNFGTASFTPGVELEFPVNERFSLRPYVKAGVGIEFETNDRAAIWEAGLKGRYTFPSRRVEWSLHGKLSAAGHNADDNDSDRISSASLGVEVRRPLNREWWGQAWDTYWQLGYTFLDRELRFDNGDGTFNAVDDVIELGFALSPSGRSFKFWRWNPERLGIGIKFSPEGDFAAVTLSTRSWFDK